MGEDKVFDDALDHLRLAELLFLALANQLGKEADLLEVVPQCDQELELLGLLGLSLVPTLCRRGPRLKMQAFKEGCAATRLALQAPVSTEALNEELPLADLDLAHVVQEAVHDHARHNRRPRAVRLGVCACSLGRYRCRRRARHRRNGFLPLPLPW